MCWSYFPYSVSTILDSVLGSVKSILCQFCLIFTETICPLNIQKISLVLYRKSSMWRKNTNSNAELFKEKLEYCNVHHQCTWDHILNVIFGLLSHFLNKLLACQVNSRLLNFSSASIFKVLQCCSKVVKMLSECLTAWIWMRNRAYDTLVVLGGLRVKIKI